MNLSEKIEHQKFIISRFDEQYDSVNNKGNFLIAFHSFLLGAIIFGNSKITDYINDQQWSFVSQILLVVLTTCSLISIYWLLRAMFPYIKSGNATATGYHSLLFFKSIKELNSPDTYFQKTNQLDENSLYKDLVYQTYQLANGLDFKFCMLSKAINLIYAEGGLLVSILLIIIMK